MKPGIYVSSSLDPYFNTAFEAFLLHRKIFPSVFVSRSKACVSLGRHQNPQRKLGPAGFDDPRFKVIRRQSAGAEMYFDLQNPCFAFVTRHGPVTAAQTRNNAILTKVFTQLGVTDSIAGLDSLSIGQKVVTRSSFDVSGNTQIHHGVVYLKFPERLTHDFLPTLSSQSLQLSKVKVFPKPIPYADWEKVFVTACQESFGPTITRVNRGCLDEHRTMSDLYEQFHSSSWKAGGRIPDYNAKVSCSFNFGDFDFYFRASDDGFISQVKVFSDCGNFYLVDLLTHALEGAKFSQVGITQALDSLAQSIGSKVPPILISKIRDELVKELPLLGTNKKI